MRQPAFGLALVAVIAVSARAQEPSPSIGAAVVSPAMECTARVLATGQALALNVVTKNDTVQVLRRETESYAFHATLLVRTGGLTMAVVELGANRRSMVNAILAPEIGAGMQLAEEGNGKLQWVSLSCRLAK